jgi:hypothetical protein
VDPPPSAQPILAAANLTDATITQLAIAIDTPVFEGYYNALTDVAIKPSGLDAPTLIILESDTDRYFPDGVTLGLDLKFQVTDIYK